MAPASLSKILEATGLERFKYSIEAGLKATSVGQLLQREDLCQAFLAIGMTERETERLVTALKNYQSRCGRAAKPCPQPMRTRHGGSAGRGSVSVPTSPAGDLPQNLIGRPPAYPVPTTNRGGSKKGAREEAHSPKCPCEACCNKRNEEYQIWFREDEASIKKCQPMTRRLEETADDVSKELELIYTKCPNKFVVPEGAAMDLRGLLANGSSEAADNPEPSPNDFERSPPKFGHIFGISWKIRSASSSVQPMAPSPPSKASLQRQKSQEEGSRAKTAGSSISRFLDRKRNKLALSISVPKNEDVKDLQLKPMSANAERKMKETFEEIEKFRHNNNSPRSPPPKTPKGSPANPKDSPSGNVYSTFKFPQERTASLPSSQEKVAGGVSASCATVTGVVSASRGGDRNSQKRGSSISNHSNHSNRSNLSNLSNRSSRSSASNDGFQIVPRGDLGRIHSCRMSSTGSTGYRPAELVEREWRRRLKIKSSRLARRTVSECKPATAGVGTGRLSAGCPFVPYLPVKSKSVELKVYRRPGQNDDGGESAVLSRLADNPLVRFGRGRKKRGESLAVAGGGVDCSSTEFVIKFKATLSLENVPAGDKSGQDPDASTRSSNGSPNGDEPVVAVVSDGPPPIVPPRAPIRRPGPALSIRESIRRKKRTEPSAAAAADDRVGFEADVAAPWIGGTYPSRGRFSKPEKAVVAVARFEHPAVYGPPGPSYVPRAFLTRGRSGGGAGGYPDATHKSYDQIPRRTSEFVPSPALDHRFSADAGSFPAVRFGRPEVGRSEDDVTISGSSSECELDQSTSYEDLMEQALDLNVIT